jgi:tetratricopeptide (TPR) repeat protein
MKRKERRHLKHNPVADMIATAQHFVDSHSRSITGALIAIVVLVVAISGFLLVRQQTQTRADTLLADAMVALNARVVPAGAAAGEDNLPAAATLGAIGTFSTEEAKLNAALPKLTTAAETYPNTPAGITARYHLASALASLGRHDESIQQFEEVVRRAGSRSLYGRMAQMGKANTHARAAEYDAAIAAWKALADERDEALPMDAILMELARAYAAKGDTDEARRTWSQLVEQHPDSIYSPEARSRLENLET